MTHPYSIEDKQRRYQSIDELRRATLSVLEAADNLKGDYGISTPAPTPALVRWIWAGIAVAILAVTAMTAYHLHDAFKSAAPPGNPLFSSTPAGDDDGHYLLNCRQCTWPLTGGPWRL